MQPRGDSASRFRADLTTQADRRRVKQIEYAGPGGGAYDSLGVYVGTGDYDVVLRATDETVLERRLESSWRVDYAPGRGLEARTQRWLDRLWRSSQWLLFASVSARTTGSAAAFWRDIPVLLLARKEGVPLASHRIRGEASALPGSRFASPRVRFERERSRNNAYAGVQTDRLHDLYALSLRSRPARAWTIEEEVQLDSSEERTGFGGCLDIERGERVGVGAGTRDRLVPARRADGRSGPSRSGAFASGSRHGSASRWTQLTPGLQWISASRTRIDLQVTRTWVAGPQWQLVRSRPGAGWESRVNASIRLRESLDATAFVERVDPDRSVGRTTARVELRAGF